MKKSPRDRRLEADYLSVRQLASESSIFSFEAPGALPTRYRMMFRGRGLARQSGGTSIVENHEVIVELGAAYPRMIPNLHWQTPIYHPNISNNGVVCLGGYGTHWVPSLTLSEMCTMLWDMIRYKNFDSNSPYNRDAAVWAISQERFQFPVDPRSIRDKLAEQNNSSQTDALTSPQSTSPAPPPPSDDVEIIDCEEVVEEPDVVSARVGTEASTKDLETDTDVLIVETEADRESDTQEIQDTPQGIEIIHSSTIEDTGIHFID